MTKIECATEALGDLFGTENDVSQNQNRLAKGSAGGLREGAG